MEFVLLLLNRVVFGGAILSIFFLTKFNKNKSVKFSDLFGSYLGFFTFGMFVVHSFIPVIQLIYPQFNRLSNYSFEDSTYSVLFCVLYYLTFLITYVSLTRFLKIKNSSVDIDSIDTSKVSCLLFLVTMPATLSVFFIVKIITQSNFAELLINRIELFRGLGGVLLLSNLFIFIGLFLFANYLKSRKFKFIFLYFIVVFFMLILFTAIGSRNSFFIFLITNLCFFSILGGGLTFRKLIFYTSIFLVFFTFVGLVRMRVDNIEEVNLFSSLFENIAHSLISVFGTDEMFRFLLEKEFVDWQFGSTFLAGVTNFIPRGIWLDKPFGAGPLLTNFISPGSYGLKQSGLSSYTTGIIAESYMNFGILSLIVIAPLNAFIGVLIDKIKVKSFYSLCLKSYFLVIFGFALFYSEFLGLLARGLYVGFPIIVSLIIVEKLTLGRK